MSVLVLVVLGIVPNTEVVVRNVVVINTSGLEEGKTTFRLHALLMTLVWNVWRGEGTRTVFCLGLTTLLIGVTKPLVSVEVDVVDVDTEVRVKMSVTSRVVSVCVDMVAVVNVVVLVCPVVRVGDIV